ncbi:hypothetical protein HPB52_011174 [Rhipicephalus sanguineus]|uniref:DDE Tnp4 domain-containing protein n=1 Tax=Rhipicephalus sanguineus TaxID=34632 RepID=A0A9D4SZZ2_RHISA|nr:hypothetical protein HPB52_011174 [Rhipicephalus sanguineus]
MTSLCVTCDEGQNSRASVGQPEAATPDTKNRTAGGGSPPQHHHHRHASAAVFALCRLLHRQPVDMAASADELVVLLQAVAELIRDYDAIEEESDDVEHHIISLLLTRLLRQDRHRRVFTHVFIGFPGRVHNARVLEESSLFRDGELKCEEGALGLLKTRFQRLMYVDVATIPQTVDIVMAACVLHNTASRSGDDVDDEQPVDHDADVSSKEPESGAVTSVLAKTVRDTVAQAL